MTRSGSEVAITPLEDWQIFYFRDNAWTNPQSSDATATAGAIPAPPAPPAPPAARQHRGSCPMACGWC